MSRVLINPIGERWLAARRAGTVPPLDRDRAACAGENPAIFFGKGTGPRAKRICARCPVAVECLDFAIRTEASSSEYGVYGGCTPIERRRLRQRLDGYRRVGVADLTVT